MNPETDAAKIRALFVHPDYTRIGIGGLVVDICEEEARKRGFKRAEMGATFAGVDFYRGRGYEVLMDQGAEGVEERKLGNGEVLRLVRMGKVLVE
jgi:GNAT superfamily N-acetyltransferase